MTSSNEENIPYRLTRLTLWRMAIDLFKLVHAYHMPGRRFGSDAGLILLWGACLVLYIESGQPVNASRLSRYIGMPNETVRRHLAKLAALRLVKREGYKFRPKVVIEDNRVEEAERRFWRAANKLYKKPFPLSKIAPTEPVESANIR